MVGLTARMGKTNGRAMTKSIYHVPRAALSAETQISVYKILNTAIIRMTALAGRMKLIVPGAPQYHLCTALLGDLVAMECANLLICIATKGTTASMRRMNPKTATLLEFFK